jgi:hypothetical protein
MNIRHLLFVILVIFAIVCSPVLAISKSDLISYYRTNSSFSVDKPKIPDSPAAPIITPIPQPTTTPSPIWPFPEFLKPFTKPTIPSSPIVKPTVTPIPTPKVIYICPPDLPYGKFRYTGCIWFYEPGEDPDHIINLKPGVAYPEIVDDLGHWFIVKPGCPVPLPPR